MLPRHKRLPANTQLKNPAYLRASHFMIKTGLNNLNYNRYGFVIGKKTTKLAVDRNRSKRLLRSCIEEMDTQLQPGYDFLFIMQKNLAAQKREILYAELVDLLRKGQLLQNMV